MSKRYPLAQSITIPITVTDRNGAPADASAISVTVHKPDGTATAGSPYTPAHDSTGVYHLDLPTADASVLGDYQYKGTATVAGLGGVFYGSFEVFDPFEPALLTVDDARKQLQYDAGDHTDDDLLREWCAAITRAVEQYKHETIAPRTVTDEIEISGYGWSVCQRFRVWSAPVISLTSVVSWDGLTTWDISNMRVSESGLVRVMAGPRVAGLVEVTYKAGYAIIPENYQQGALIILQQIWETRRGAAGTVPGAEGVVGPEDLFDRRLAFDIPHKAKEWLGPPRPVVS